MSWLEQTSFPDIESMKPRLDDVSYSREEVSHHREAIQQQEMADIDSISDEELDAMLNANYNLVDFKNTNQVNRWEVIDTNNQSISNFTEIRSLLAQNVTWKIPQLDSILARWEDLLHSEDPLPDLELSQKLAEITQDAIDYLKQPQNREALVFISRELEKSDPVKFKEFQTFLIAHDPEFTSIFESIAMPMSKQELAIVAAMPGIPDRGNMEDGFAMNLNDETKVQVIPSGENVLRSLSLWNATLPTEVLDVNISEAQEAYSQDMENLWSKQVMLESIRSAFDNNPDADISTLMDMLKSTYPEIASLGLDTSTDKQTLLSRIDERLTQIKVAIERVEKNYRRAISDAVHKTRELYKAIDRKANQTLLRLRNLGLDKWNLEALIREMMAGQLIPDLGIAFSTDNLDLANQNFWEPESLTDTFDVFNDNLTRFANKGLTGNPEGLDEKWNLIGFSLASARLNPNAQTKTDGELMHLMESQGIMKGGVFNLNKVRENLRKPIEA